MVLLTLWLISHCVLTTIAMELTDILRADILSKFPSKSHLEDEYRRFLFLQTQSDLPSNYILELSPSCDWSCHLELKNLLRLDHYDLLHSHFALVMKKQYSMLQGLVTEHSSILRILPLLPEMKIDPSIDMLLSSCGGQVRTIRICLVALTQLEFHAFHQRLQSYTTHEHNFQSHVHVDTSEFRPETVMRCISAKVSCAVAAHMIRFLSMQPEVLLIDEKK